MAIVMTVWCKRTDVNIRQNKDIEQSERWEGCTEGMYWGEGREDDSYRGTVWLTKMEIYGNGNTWGCSTLVAMAENTATRSVSDEEKKKEKEGGS